MQFIVGVIFGIIVSSIGFSGVATVLDKAIGITRDQSVKIVNESKDK
jgi:hypothetical protein